VVGVGAAPSLPLSPQGQARRLIEEVTTPLPTSHFRKLAHNPFSANLFFLVLC